jgi:hypothetical protein
MERHCEYGTHSRALEKITLQDRAKVCYAQHLHESQIKKPPCLHPSSTMSQSEHTKLSKIGWALKSNPKKVRFSEKQKSFLEKKFLQGEQSGKKSNAKEVASEMRKVRGDNEKRLFCIDEFLTVQQISSYFSRFAAKRKQLTESEYESAEKNGVLCDVREEIIATLEKESRHPIIYQEMNLCQMTTDELSSLRIRTLRCICLEHCVQVSGRRKAPYVEGVISLVSSCSCRQ